MKHRTKLLFGLLSLVLNLMPASMWALTMQATYNSSSTIDYGQYLVTCDDGTVLGFYKYSNTRAYFAGAITDATAINVPDTIVYSGNTMVVTYCGYSSRLDLDEAPNVASITLPATVSNIYAFPATVSELHLQSATPPNLDYSVDLSSVIVYVPQSAYSTYVDYCNSGRNRWSTSIDVVYEGWEPKAYTINVPSAGQFGNLLLNGIEQWTDVGELTVSGSLNADDLALISRMKRIRKLDLSQTDITSFVGCNGLTRLQTVVLPLTVTSIGENAFSGCTSLRNIDIPRATALGRYAFGGCKNLQSVKIPAVTEIQEDCFYSCQALNDIDLSNVRIIGTDAFHSCHALTKVDLSSATKLSSSIFHYCHKLSDVTLSDELTSIPNSMFQDCDSLSSITLPSFVKSIGSCAFSGTSLKSIVIPEGCKTIGQYAFSGCPMETISIPSTMTQIGSDAFSSSVVKDLYCHVVVPFSTSAFSNMASATLHVPEFSVNAYRLHDDWYNFLQTVAIEGDIEKLNINQSFTIYAYDGLANGVDVTLDYGMGYDEWGGTTNIQGHLTVDANSAFSVGTYLQYQDLYSYDDYYDWKTDSYVYGCNPYCTTLITQNEMTADNVSVHAYLPTNRWSFISFPYDVNVSDIVVPEGTLWVVRKYSGEDRAAMTGYTWQNMIDGTVLKAGEGYIFHCYLEEYSTVEVQFPAAKDAGTLFAYDDVVKTLAEYPSEFAHNRSWNLVGNPYPAYFNTQEIEFDAPITVWNGSGYTAYSLLDDNYVLSPNQAFFVQRPTTSATMTFHKEGRMHSSGTMAETEYAPSFSRARSASASRFVFNFLLADTAYADRARLVVNEEAKMEYEANCDASKFMSDNTDVPQLYIIDGGVKYAIDERPLGSGIITLGTYFGMAGEYTLSLSTNPNEESAVMLTDHHTGMVTNLAVDSYTFTAEAGTDNNRFTIALAPTTDIEDSMADEAAIDEVYTLDGKQVKDIKSLPSGAYLVKKGNEYVKHIVK